VCPFCGRWKNLINNNLLEEVMRKIFPEAPRRRSKEIYPPLYRLLAFTIIIHQEPLSCPVV
jgi:hypothetical protein